MEARFSAKLDLALKMLDEQLKRMDEEREQWNERWKNSPLCDVRKEEDHEEEKMEEDVLVTVVEAPKEYTVALASSIVVEDAPPSPVVADPTSSVFITTEPPPHRLSVAEEEDRLGLEDDELVALPEDAINIGFLCSTVDDVVAVDSVMDCAIVIAPRSSPQCATSPCLRRAVHGDPHHRPMAAMRCPSAHRVATPRPSSPAAPPICNNQSDTAPHQIRLTAGRIYVQTNYQHQICLTADQIGAGTSRWRQIHVAAGITVVRAPLRLIVVGAHLAAPTVHIVALRTSLRQHVAMPVLATPCCTARRGVSRLDTSPRCAALAARVASLTKLSRAAPHLSPQRAADRYHARKMRSLPRPTQSQREAWREGAAPLSGGSHTAMEGAAPSPGEGRSTAGREGHREGGNTVVGREGAVPPPGGREPQRRHRFWWHWEAD
ncbi:hypothetical protein GUJ93_ZPchr0006g42373 [Zizania palustris]|uniref:Uncharacterized protein n=1 Tax=Zizania palustris TaxID=103762 RepID=A0A8J5TDB5_ZIZPA|nr:hypothetical protein GUJ93_ZPchr0006g42373 [Zizania palustris]